MENMSIQIDNILDNAFLKTLLKNDVVIYGKFIRDVIINNMSMEKYSKNYYNVINCYAKYIYMDV